MVSTETVMLKQCSWGQEVLATSQEGHKYLPKHFTVFENQDLTNQVGFQSVLKLQSLSKVCHICNLLVVLSNSLVMFCFVLESYQTNYYYVLNQFLVCKIGILYMQWSSEWRPGIDLVVRDLACHVISLNAGCLWVTPSAIPGLHWS